MVNPLPGVLTNAALHIQQLMNARVRCSLNAVLN